MNRWRGFLCAAACLAAGTVVAANPAGWLSKVETPPDAAHVTPPRPFTAGYRGTWAGLTAARAEVECTLPPNAPSEVQSVLKTSTAGLTRSLWQMDAVHTAVADRRTLRPLRIDETDKREAKEIKTHIDFPPGAAVRVTRTWRAGEPPPSAVKPKRFEYPDLLDMNTALLNLRSVPLAAGESHVTLVMTATNPYVVTLKVLGRETIEVKAGKRPAIKCSVALQKVGKDGELQAQKKFKSAAAWISDDADHVLLKVEAKIFIGSVVLELERLAFTDG